MIRVLKFLGLSLEIYLTQVPKSLRKLPKLISQIEAGENSKLLNSLFWEKQNLGARFWCKNDFTKKSRCKISVQNPVKCRCKKQFHEKFHVNPRFPTSWTNAFNQKQVFASSLGCPVAMKRPQIVLSRALMQIAN